MNIKGGVIINTCETAPIDYSKLRGKIVEVYGTLKVFAKNMEMADVSLWYKLTNKREFKQREIMKAARLLQIDKKDIPLYFFNLEVQNNEQ